MLLAFLLRTKYDLAFQYFSITSTAPFCLRCRLRVSFLSSYARQTIEIIHISLSIRCKRKRSIVGQCILLACVHVCMCYVRVCVVWLRSYVLLVVPFLSVDQGSQVLLASQFLVSQTSALPPAQINPDSNEENMSSTSIHTHTNERILWMITIGGPHTARAWAKYFSN
jgi:hypothetical protein